MYTCINSVMFQLTEDYCKNIRATSYIGQKGYTLWKDHVHKSDFEQIKKDLFKIPAVNGKPQKDLGFPIYRENARKLYLPRFYALERYRGQPAKSELNPLGGSTIQCPFEGTLQPHQIDAIQQYKQHIATGSPGAILELPCGYGKCLAAGTLVMMHDGTIRRVETIKVGERLMGDDSEGRKVLTTSVGEGPLFEVSGGGHKYTGNADHILSLCKSPRDGQRQVLDISIQEYLHLSAEDRAQWSGYRVAVDWPEKQVLTPPYWMGYGCLDLKRESWDKMVSMYWVNSKSVRGAFMAGLLDSVGEMNTLLKVIHLPCRLPDRAKQIIFLGHSLGIDIEIHPQDPTLCEIRGLLPTEVLLKLQKTEFKIPLPPLPNPLCYDMEITPVHTGKYYGFEIDGNRRFLLADLTVTHNTVLALSLVADLSKKTMILVHKEFLMNQWIERIRQFLPNARVGVLQGKKCETEDVDICLGMIQSIYNKEFTPTTFQSFGLTIIDEVHRIGSAEFSGVLSRIVTPLMLGISATVDRKDKLTDILYAFIGPKIHSVRRRNDDCVEVRAIEFSSKDAAFQEVETDYRGQVKYSTMISKLCAFAPRSDFIVRVLLDQFKEYPEKQMIVLGHNRCLLVYIYEILAALPPGEGPTVGYYLGGMKQDKLEASESKQIVLATYAMASEALDIKTLSTLCLVTPKTDIVQSVGRILRMKHSQPLILDIVDGHSCFQNQWNKRRLYYKQCHYEIWKTNSANYPTGWKKLTKGDLEPGQASRVVDSSVDLIDV